MKRRKIIDLFPAWLDGGGIFAAIEQAGYTYPWADKIAANILDLEYFGNHSGDKTTSVILDRLAASGALAQADINKLAQIIIGMYGERWSKLYGTTKLQYDPIENYSMTEHGVDTVDGNATSDDTHVISRIANTTGSETETRSGTDTETPGVKETESETRSGTDTETPGVKETENETRSGTDTETPGVRESETETRSGTDTETPGVTETETGTGKSTQANNVYAFNSTEAVPKDTQADDTTTSRTMARDGTNKLEKSETVERTTTKDGSNTIDKSESVKRETTRDGSNTMERSESVARTTEKEGSNTVEKSETVTRTPQLKETDDTTDDTVRTETRHDTTEHTLTRSGNIGVTTSQQMIAAERDVWMWIVFDVVFADVDKILTCPLY